MQQAVVFTDKNGWNSIYGPFNTFTEAYEFIDLFIKEGHTERGDSFKVEYLMPPDLLKKAS